MCTNMVFNREWAFGAANLFLTRPKIAGFDLGVSRNFMIVALVVLAASMLLLRHLLAGTTGRFAVALRGSPTAAASIGINGVPLRVAIFGLSAGLAGLAGGFLGFLNRGISPNSYTVGTSLYWMVVAMVVGVYTMRSAVAAGLILVLLPRFIGRLPDSLALFEFVLFGLGVVLLARRPEGAFEYFANLPARMRERTRMLSGSSTVSDHEATLARLMAEPEVVPDQPGKPVEVLHSSVEERLERRRRRRELGIELARLRARIPAFPISYLYILTLAFAVDAMSRSLLSIVYDDVRRDFGVTDFKMSALNAGFAIVAGVSFIPFGILADRWDRKKIVALGFVPWALAMAWQSVAGTFMMMFIARLFLGSIEGTHGPTVPSLLGDYYPVKRRNRAFGIFATGSSLGNILGFMIGGALAESLGWRAAFFVFGVIGGVAGLVVWFVLDEPQRGMQDAAARLEAEIDAIDRLEELEAQALNHPDLAEGILAREATLEPLVDAALAEKAPHSFDYRDISAWDGLKLVFQNKTFTLLLIGQVATDFFLGILGLYAITFFRRYHGMSLTGASGIVSLLTFALIIGVVQAGRIGDRLVGRGTPAARVKLTWLCRVLVFVSVVLAWGPQNLALAIPGFLATGYFLGLTTPLTTAMSVDLMVARLRGVSAGFIAGLRAAATAAGPLLVGWIADQVGLRQGILMLSPVLLLSAVVTWLAARFYDKDADETQAEAVRQHLLEEADPRDATPGVAVPLAHA
jgi:MFS family permease